MECWSALYLPNVFFNYPTYNCVGTNDIVVCWSAVNKSFNVNVPRLLESPGILFSIFKGLESPGKWNDPGKWSWNSSWCFLKMLVEHASIRHLWRGSLFKILIARLNFHPKMCQKCLTTGLCPEPTGGSLSAPQDLATVVSEGVNTLSHYVTAVRGRFAAGEWKERNGKG